jgi:phosphoribosylglycinamide formyltransferase-1
MNIAVFASGSGTNLRAIVERERAGQMPGVRVVLLVTNNSASGAAVFARERGIAVAHVSARTHPSEEHHARHLLELLGRHAVGLIVLAGYMKLLPPAVVSRYAGRILNVHPALLPRFGGPGMYGLRVHEAVLAAGEPETGITVHKVTERYDEGEIVAQARVPVLAGDTPETLQGRVLAREHELYWRVILDVAGRLPC